MLAKNIVQIVKIIKAAAKSQGLTHSLIAKRLQVSEPTVKRWLRGDGISIQQWLRLLEVVGLRLSDLASALDEPSLDQFEYSKAQESALAENEGLLAFFQSLLLGHSPLEIMKSHSLSKVSTAGYLRRLDQIGLIDWSEGMTCRLKVQGEPRWRKNGALAKKFREQLLNQFIWPRKSEECFRLGVYELAKTDIQEVSESISKVFEVAKNSEKKARILKLKTETICLATCMDQHSPDFLYKIPDRKTGSK